LVEIIGISPSHTIHMTWCLILRSFHDLVVEKSHGGLLSHGIQEVATEPCTAVGMMQQWQSGA
jgi:hypothetical protein